jgi:predicted histone-like DNA-binding protein
MAIDYKPVPKWNPSNRQLPPKYFMQLINGGTVSQREVAQQISERTSLSKADTAAMVEAMLEVIPQMLAEGKIVRLGEFGSFSLSVSSTGADAPEQLNSGHFSKVNVRFRPGKEFSHMLDTIVYNKV